MSKLINIVGEKYNKLTVLEYLGKSLWKCVCECGNFTEVKTYSLKNNNTKTCGCKVGLFLNMSRSPEYATWTGMKQRCSNPNIKIYPYYGGRGIKVCDSWLNSFENFYEDMGDRPSAEHSLDRKSVNEGYNKENCRWVEIDIQNRNKRSTRYIIFNDKIQSLVSHCEELNLNYETIISRLNKYNWSIEKTLSTPTGKPYIKRTNKK